MRIKPTVSFLVSHPFHLISLGFGSGLSPIMPGTAGTIWGWVVFHLFVSFFPSVFTQFTWAAIVILGFLLGCKTCTKTGEALNSPDDGAMVWDEIIGIWLVFLVVMPQSFCTEVFLFFLFRVFDMTKPPPIKQIDARVKGGFGVMLDDILAALFAIIVYQLIHLIASKTGYVLHF